MNLKVENTDGVAGLCLDPHDLLISKYIARREKDIAFNAEVVRSGMVSKEKLLELLQITPVSEAVKARICLHIEADFRAGGSNSIP